MFSLIVVGECLMPNVLGKNLKCYNSKGAGIWPANQCT
jgi:hypothetical protein